MEKQKTKPGAIVLTNGYLAKPDAKTAHGLIRGTERFQILAIIDQEFAGKDAGVILDGLHRNIPVFATVADAIAEVQDIAYCIIGIATVGGVLPESFIPVLKFCIMNGISIVNGLHEFLNDNAELSELANRHQVTLTDVRKPKARKELHFWTGEILKLQTPVIAVIGMDCAMGKRTTCRMIRDTAKEAGIKAEMIYTGQTGWLQGGEFGFVFDTTANDFISGELEHSILSCAADKKPDLILVEGQSALRNPSGPCGSEILISGNAKHTVLLVSPKRKYYEGLPEWGEIPSISSEIELIKILGSKVIAIAINTEQCSLEEAKSFQKIYAEQFNIPVLLPIQEGVEALIPELKKIINPLT